MPRSVDEGKTGIFRGGATKEGGENTDEIGMVICLQTLSNRYSTSVLTYIVAATIFSKNQCGLSENGMFYNFKNPQAIFGMVSAYATLYLPKD